MIVVEEQTTNTQEDTNHSDWQELIWIWNNSSSNNVDGRYGGRRHYLIIFFQTMDRDHDEVHGQVGEQGELVRSLP